MTRPSEIAMNEEVPDRFARERAELAALRLEKGMLCTQVKKLIQAESTLYQYQEQLDAQLKEYQGLYALSRKLNASFELPAIFECATAYIIYSLNYERVLFFQRSGAAGDYAICAMDGYYEQREKEEVSGLTVSEDDPCLRRLLGGEEYLVCTRGCESPELAALREKAHMDEYLFYPLGSQTPPVAFLAVGNSAQNAEYYRRVSDAEGELVSIGNLVGLLSSAVENQMLYAGMKTALEQERQMKAQLLQSQKLESIGRLAGGVAHDFNNMLTVILGCAQLALLRVPEGEKLWKLLDQISRAAQRSSDITRQLLAFSRKEIISPKVVNLNAQIIETQATLGRLIGEDINLSFKPVTNIWSVKVDPSQLDQILVNLAVNARDAMVNGGRLEIETANVRIDKIHCQFHPDSTPGDYVRLLVSDSGSGMDMQTLAHIFEPLFTTQEVGTGTGLGLAMVYGIVRQNNGFISVQSEPGQGTTFQLYFPRFAEEVPAEVRMPRAEVSGCGTVLLVEDDLLVREMSLEMLQEIGYTVIQAGTPREAIETCARDDVQVDLILTDVVMPGMNGKEMVGIIESMRPGIKVLFMSGYTSDLVAQRGVVDIGRHFIQKPFDMHLLNEKMKDTLLGAG